MGVRIDTQNDWQDVENLESLMLLSKTAEAPPSTGPVIPNCKFFPINKDEMTGDALLATMDAVIRSWRNQMSGIVPKKYDIWVRQKDGTRWIIQEVQILSFGNAYKMPCIKDLSGGH